MSTATGAGAAPLDGAPVGADAAGPTPSRGPVPAAPQRVGRRPGIFTVLRWELRKLRAQRLTWAAAGAAALIPVLIVLGTELDDGPRGGGDGGIPLAGALGVSGFSVPLVGLFFATAFLLPLLSTLAAGDAIAGEQRHGTLKTILTRSVERTTVYVGKALASLLLAVALLLVFVGSGLLVGGLAWGFDPLQSLSGTTLTASQALWRTVLATAVVTMPLLAVASIALLLSSLTRSAAAAVVGAMVVLLVMGLVTLVPALRGWEPYLLTGIFGEFTGVLRDPVDLGYAGRVAWVSAAYAVPALVLGGVSFARRDVTGG